MRNTKWITILVLIVFIAGSMLLIGGCAKKPAPKPLPNTPDMQGAQGLQGTEQVAPQMPVEMPARMVIGYYENPWPGTPDKTGSFPSMKTFYKSMTAVAPFWYRATKDGTLEAKDSQQVLDTTRQLGLKVIPLVTNKSGATDEVLGDPAIRAKVTDAIAKLLTEKQYDGVNIDFELLPPKHRDNLTAFMAELYPKVKALNKTVIISVFPQVDVAADVSGAYDYPNLAKNTDFLQIMTYDHHWGSSPPGPIASIDWYEKNIKYAIDQAGGPNKVIIGVGAYGYDWSTQGGEAETLTYVDAIVRAEQHGAKIEYDDSAQAPHFKYDGHEVWFENDKSTAAKLDVVAKYNPAGIAIWRIGQEQPEIWPIIDQKFPRQQ